MVIGMGNVITINLGPHVIGIPLLQTHILIGAGRCDVLTIVAERAPIGRHGTVTGEALPLLQTHTLIGAGILCAGCTRAWEGDTII